METKTTGSNLEKKRTNYNLTIHTENESVFTRDSTANIVGVSLELLDQCVEEGILQPRLVSGGRSGFTEKDLEQIEVIRRLIEDLELDLPTIDIVLRMRERIINLLNELGTLEDEMFRRHSQLENEITILRRRIAEEAQWENET
jgi:DNA-binding transcriptional MerR regulator